MWEDDEVRDISYFMEYVDENDTWIAVDQIHAGVGTSSDPGLKHSSQGGYTGSGVKIGIIEAGSGVYDTDNPQLKSLHNSGQLSQVAVSGVIATTSDHATLVTTIVCGEAKSAWFRPDTEGIATDATVYQSPIRTSTHTYTAFQQFADLNVDVINYSAGSATSTYTSYDREIDNLIYTTKIVFIKSAGNTSGNISSPGKAYNAITVGNAKTKSAMFTGLNPPYDMSASSSHDVPSYMSNKPEVVAPGTHIAYNLGIWSSGSNSGTSFAAPMVTGIVAQLMEKRKTMVNVNNYITYFKAVMILGAEEDKINDNETRTDDPDTFFNVSGAGLVNAVKSSVAGETQIYRSLNTMYYSVKTLFSGSVSHDFRFVLVFEKPEDMDITAAYENDFDLVMTRVSDQAELDSSRSDINTFEILECTTPLGVEVLIGFETQSIISSDLEMSISCVWNTL